MERLRVWIDVGLGWLDRVDPGMHRRIKGLRLVTAYGIAALLGTLQGIGEGGHRAAVLSFLAGGFALWASIYEGQTTRAKSASDLVLFCAAAVAGAVSVILTAPLLGGIDTARAELVLVPGAFLVSYLKRFGVTGAGIGSQLYMGQLFCIFDGLGLKDFGTICVAGVLAAVACVVPRVLSGPAEKPVVSEDVSVPAVLGGRVFSAEMLMGVQAAVAALAIIALNGYFGLVEPVWAITACTYVVAGSTAGTVLRIRHRVIGTAIGVPLGIALIPIVPHALILIWVLAAFAMVVYAMALPERYDIACGAYAFTLIVTLVADGESSLIVLAARLWETALGGALGLGLALLLVPIRKVQA